MKIKTRMMVLISILLMISVSCQMATDFLPFGGPNSSSSTAAATSPTSFTAAATTTSSVSPDFGQPTSNPNPSSFTAQATSPISVQLTWSAVDGAQKYLIGRADDQQDFSALAEISGGNTSFEDFLVPANTPLSYRIQNVTASGTSNGKTTTVTTPAEKPNPLTVKAAFETQSAQSQAIGAEGGSLSVKDSRGVSYTLTIPAGALDSQVTFTLTPIQDIQDLPLSGGMTSGVRIEPEGLHLDPPATLSVGSPQPEPSDGLVSIGFAFDGAGSEFHFEPGGSAEQANATGAVKLASFLPGVNAAKGKIWYVDKTRSQGDGRGTAKEIRDQVKNHPPSTPADNLNQKMAAGDGDINVLVVIDAVLLGTGRDVELQVAGATGWLEFTMAQESFQSWLDSLDAQKNHVHKDQLDKREEAIWEALDLEARILLDKAAKDCKKSPNLPHAKSLVNQLLNGKSPFYKKFAEKFSQKYGADALKKVKAKLDECTPSYQLEFDSTFVSNTFTPVGSKGPINVTQHVRAVVPLAWSEKDQTYTGQAPLAYVLFDVPPIIGMGGDGGYFVPCPNTTSATGGIFRVLQLKGLMDTTTPLPGQTLVSSLELTIDPGTTVESVVPVCPPPATVPPGFSFPFTTWSEQFASAHNQEAQAGKGPYIIKDWVTGSEKIVAVKSYSSKKSATIMFTITENTTITLVQK